jgi:hypothetical protein
MPLNARRLGLNGTREYSQPKTKIVVSRSPFPFGMAMTHSECVQTSSSRASSMTSRSQLGKGNEHTALWTLENIEVVVVRFV